MMASTQSVSSSGTITFSGLASGIDTSSIVSQLIALDAAPEKVLNGEVTTDQSQIAAFNQLSTALGTLQTLMTGMNTPDTFAEMTASIADSSVGSVTASGSAQAGTHTLTVTSLAQSQTMVSESSTKSGYASDTAHNFGTGTFTITNTSDPQDPATININSTNNSLQGIAAAINASGANVTASVVNDGSNTPYRLVITGNDTSTYSVTSNLTGGSYDAPTFNTVVNASQADFTLDGISMTRTSNTVTGAIPGVTLTLQGLTTGSSDTTSGSSGTTITIGNNDAAVTSQINSFVSDYNNVMNLINTDTAFSSTSSSTTSGSGPSVTTGVLFGDPSVQNILSSLQSVLTSQVSGVTGSFTSLADIGITSDPQTGLLSVNSTQLSSALSTDFNGVTALFTQNSGIPGMAQNQYGITEQFNQQISNLIDAYSSDGSQNTVIPTAIQGLNDNITSLNNQVASMQQQLTIEENTLNAQFASMETTISNTQAWGNELLAGLGDTTSTSSTSSSS
jgi:flagellar hook-associated protein 2